MPGLMALRSRYAGKRAAGGRPHHGQPAHDGADGRADRDADRARRRRALGVVQHLLDPGSCGGGRRCRPTRDGWDSGLSEGHPGVCLEGRDTCRGTGGARPKRSSGPTTRVRRSSSTMAATRRCSCTRPRSSSKAGKVPAFNPDAEPEEWGVILDVIRQQLKRIPGRWTAVASRHSRCQRRDDHRRSSSVPDDGGRHAALSGHQRQRLGDEEQVRQHLRLPPLAAGWSRARNRRDAWRQSCRRHGLRRSRQGMRAGAARPGLPRRRHGNRSDLRAAGGDGGLRGDDARGCRRDGGHLHHGDRQPEHRHRSITWRA